MGSGQAEVAYFEGHAKLCNGWTFTEGCKVERAVGQILEYEDKTSYPYPGYLFSTRKIAQQQRDLWMRNVLPLYTRKVKDLETGLKKAKKKVFKFKSHLAKVRKHKKETSCQ